MELITTIIPIIKLMMKLRRGLLAILIVIATIIIVAVIFMTVTI